MVAAIAITPASGSVIALESACRVNVTGASTMAGTTAIPYRLVAAHATADDLISHEFVVSSTGLHQWDNVIFPDDGSWSITLVDQRDDSTAATLAVTVTA